MELQCRRLQEKSVSCRNPEFVFCIPRLSSLHKSGDTKKAVRHIGLTFAEENLNLT